MELPEAIKQLLFQFDARFPVPQGQPGDAHEENVRQWTLRFCQQTAFSFPHHGYGAKCSAPGYPVSKDSLAKQSAAFGLESWDLLLGVGTGAPQLAHDPEYHHIPQQVFIEVVPVNHLGVPVPPVPPTPVPDPVPVPAPCQAIDAAAEVLEALHEMRLEQSKVNEAILRALARLEDANRKSRKVAVSGRWQSLSGKVEGIEG